MSGHPKPSPKGHLEYYVEHAISPVRYETSDFDAHLDRRDSLYRSLGLPPIAFKGAHVLEVAPGSGQNSLYVASCLPSSLTLVEPNPAGQADIEAAYQGLERAHTSPDLVRATLQDFEPGRRYDIVICENWLGALPDEVALLRRLAALVEPGGALAMTMVPLAGFFPNVMRKLLALRLVSPDLDFEGKTAALTEVFGPHLSTIENMTRSHRDWVQDCVVNPHYLNVGLPLETLLEAVGGGMEMLATFPRFATDWRWFKGLFGKDRGFNAHFAGAEAVNLLSFIDSRKVYPAIAADRALSLHEALSGVHGLALAWQAAQEAGDTAGLAARTEAIGQSLGEIERQLLSLDSDLGSAIAELRAVWSRPELSAAEVRDMRKFGKLFGRETVYVSLTRPRAAAAS